MKKHITLVFTLAFFVTALLAQEVRTYDGSKNHHEDWVDLRDYDPIFGK